MHYYQFNIADWALHTSHLTLEEEAVYRRLIDHYYDTESPIPKETKPVIRRLRLGNYSDIVGLILTEYFNLDADGWHNSRADIEILEYHSKVETAKKNGRKGGRPKKNSGLETQSVILANPEETGLKANYKLLTINQELNTPLPPEGGSKEVNKIPDCPHKEIIQAYHESLPELQGVIVDRWAGSTRARDLAARWRESDKHQSVDFWKRYFAAMRTLPFYMGENDRNWKADLGWLIKRKNFDSTLEKLRAAR